MTRFDNQQYPMRNGFLLLCVIAFCCTSLLACTLGSETLDPDTLPYTLKEVDGESKFYPADLDGDGRDERVRVSKNVPSREHSALILRQYDYQLIGEQLDYSEHAEIEGTPFVLDVDSDNVLEVLLAIVRNDSLFLSIVDGQTATERKQIFLTNGAPQSQGSGFIPWDPHVRAVFREDLDRDGIYELVTVISTGYVPQPRGIFIHSLDDGRLLDDYLIGADPNHIFSGDFDDDDQWEIVFATGAPNNGGDAGGLDDRHAYLAAINLTLPMTEKWVKEKGELKSDMFLLAEDFDGDGKAELLAYKNTLNIRPEQTVLEFIDPHTGDSYNPRTMPEQLLDVEVVDLHDHAEAEILALGQSGTLYVLNSKLEIVRRLPLPLGGALRHNALQVLPDIDRDGVDELSVRIGSKTFLLSPDFRVKAAFPSGQIPYALLRPGSGQSPLLLTTSEAERDRTYIYRFTKNHLYLVNRYGPRLIWIILGVLWLVAGFLIVSFYRKNRQLDEAFRNMVRTLNAQTIDDFIGRAFEVVGNHYSDSRFNVEAFADEMGCSPRKLQRDLKAKIGRSPSHFIRTFRLEHAKKLLEDSDLTIKEVAHKVGFESPEHFSTTFRKDEGVSPSAYRKKITASSSSTSS